MGFKIIVSPRALKEIEHAIEYYALYSSLAPGKFLIVIQKAFQILAQNPYFEVSYKEVRSIKLEIFPYTLYFVINEEIKQVKILSCFHNKINPHSRPK